MKKILSKIRGHSKCESQHVYLRCHNTRISVITSCASLGHFIIVYSIIRGSAHLSLRLRCACPAGKLHSASAPFRTPCSLCRRNGSFPAVQWMRWGADAPGNKGVCKLSGDLTLLKRKYVIHKGGCARLRVHVTSFGRVFCERKAAFPWF